MTREWYIDADRERVRLALPAEPMPAIFVRAALDRWLDDPTSLRTLIAMAEYVAPECDHRTHIDDADGIRRLRETLVTAFARGALVVEPMETAAEVLARAPKVSGASLGKSAKSGAPAKSAKSASGLAGDPGDGQDGKTAASPVEDPTGWFEVTVVDAWGEPIGDVPLEIAYAGTRKKLTTPSNGRVRLEKVDASFGSARILDVPGTRELVRSRVLKTPPTTPPAVPNPTQVALTDDLDTVPLITEVPKTIVVVKPLTRVRLVGMHFDTNKSFMRPTAVRGIRLAVTEAEKSPKGHVLIVGHTDSVGPEDENLGLSVDRAEAVQAYLKNDVKAWEAWFSESKLQKTRWGNLEIAQMISALPCEQSVAGFQQWSNDNKKTTLVVDGKPGELTRRALIRAYMELGGTTLPDGIGLAVHGCGEFFPAEDVDDGVADEENRRVEMFCFDDAIVPPVPGKRAKKGEKEYPQWQDQVTKNVDVTTNPIRTVRVRLTDMDRNPIPNARCRIRDEAKGFTHDADAEGWLTLDVGSEESVVLEWDSPAFPDRFGYCRELTLIDAAAQENEAGERRLRHLGYQGDALEALVEEFQVNMRRPITGKLADIRDELFGWHDGGPRPAPSSPG